MPLNLFGIFAFPISCSIVTALSHGFVRWFLFRIKFLLIFAFPPLPPHLFPISPFPLSFLWLSAAYPNPFIFCECPFPVFRDFFPVICFTHGYVSMIILVSIRALFLIPSDLPPPGLSVLFRFFCSSPTWGFLPYGLPLFHFSRVGPCPCSSPFGFPLFPPLCPCVCFSHLVSQALFLLSLSLSLVLPCRPTSTILPCLP